MGKHENAVVKECERVLSLAGIPHFRNNSGAVVTGKRFFRYGATGWPDIIGILPGGRMLGVECKAVNPTTKRKGTQSPEQVAIAETFAKCGALYILCYDAVTLVQNLRAEGVKW